MAIPKTATEAQAVLCLFRREGCSAVFHMRWREGARIRSRSTGYEEHERELAEAALEALRAGRSPIVRDRLSSKFDDRYWTAALGHLRSGTPMKWVHAMPGMPTAWAWATRLKKDAAFRAEVEEIRRSQTEREPDPAHKILGEAPRLYLQPEFVHRKRGYTSAAVYVIVHGCRSFSTRCGPDDREEAERKLAAYIAGRDPRLDKRTPPRLVVREDPASPETDVVRPPRFYIEDNRRLISTRCTVEERAAADQLLVDYKNRGRAALPSHTYHEADFKTVAEALKTRPLHGFREPGLPTQTTIYNRMSLDPVIRGIIMPARQERQAWREQQAIARQQARLQQRGRDGPHGGYVLRKRRDGPQGDYLLRKALSQNEIYAAVERIVPRGLPSFMRDDIRSEMIADVIEGFLEMDELAARARSYVTAYNRQNDIWRTRSLDAPMFGDSTRSLYDVMGA